MKQWFRSLFIPSQDNSYAPQSLQKVAVVGIFALVLLSFTLTGIQSLVWVGSDWMVSTILPAVIVTDTNTERAGEALAPLTRSAVLDAAAQLKAEDMAKNQYFAHYSPTGVSPWHWFAEAGYNYVHAGENLAVYFTDSGEVVNAWMQSPTHRANIMDGKFTEIGIGTAETTFEGYPTIFVVQLFGTPGAAQPVAAAPSAAASAELAVAEPTTETGSSIVDPAALTPAPAEAVLADSSTITETVEVIPAPPVPATTTPIASSTAATTTPVSYELSFMSTTTGGVPATVVPISGAAAEVPFWHRLLVEPQTVLMVLYALIAGFVLVALGLSIGIEIRHQQPVQIAYGFALIALMGGLLYLQLWLTSGAIIT